MLRIGSHQRTVPTQLLSIPKTVCSHSCRSCGWKPRSCEIPCYKPPARYLTNAAVFLFVHFSRKELPKCAYGGQGWDASAGEDRYRRSIYTHIKRTAPFAMITTFDGLSGEACVANRNRSNTPLQALTLLNDVMFVDMAEAASRHILESAALATDDAKITQLFRQLLTRKPDQDELASLSEFVIKQRTAFEQNPALARQLLDVAEKDQKAPDEDVVELAVWTATARALFGVDEAVTRP